jgi:hypothetical protein
VTASTKPGAPRRLAIVGVASIVIAVVISLTTDGTVDWAWGAMTLATIIGLAFMSIAAWMAVRRGSRGRHAVSR